MTEDIKVNFRDNPPEDFMKEESSRMNPNILKMTGGMLSGDEEKDLERIKKYKKKDLDKIFIKNNIATRWEDQAEY